MTDLANLVVRMQADNSQYIKALDKATTRLQRFQQEQLDLLKDLGAQFAAAFSIDKLVEFSLGSIEAAAKLQNFSESAGVSVEKLSGMQLVAATTGISIEELGNSFKKLNVAASEAAGDAESKSALAFRLLGVNVRDTNGHIKDAVALSDDIADAFHGTEDGANKVAIAIALMGRQGEQMIPTLNKGSGELRRLRDEAAAAGLTLGSDAAKQAEALQEQLDRLKAEVTGGISNALRAELVPSLTAASEAFGEGASRADAYRIVAQEIAAAFKIIASIGIEVAREFTSVGDAIGGAAAAVNAAAHLNFAEARRILDDQHAQAEANEKRYTDALAALWNTSADAQGAMAKRGADAAADAQKKAQLGSLAAAQKQLEADKELQKFADNIKDQALSFGLGGAALVKYRLQFGPLADAYKLASAEGRKAAAQAIAYANALQIKEDTKAGKELVDSLREQTQHLNESDVAAFNYKLHAGDLGQALDRLAKSGHDLRPELIALSNQVIDEKDAKAVQAINDQLDQMNGKLVAAAQNQFDLQTRGLVQNLTARGDDGALARVSALRDATTAEAAFAEQQQKATEIEAAYAAAIANVNLLRSMGALNDTQASKAANDALLTEIQQLQAVKGSMDQLAQSSGLLKLKDQAAAFGTQLLTLQAQTDQMTKSIREGMESAFGNNFADLLEGAESASKFLHNFFSDIRRQLDQIVSKDLAQSLFGSGGPGGSLPGFLSQLLGGGGQGGGQSASFQSLLSLIGLGSGGGSSANVASAKELGGLADALIGSVQIGAFAGGGTIKAGSFGLVGEDGPELAYAGNRNLQIEPMAAGGGRAIHQTNVFKTMTPGGTISRRSQGQLATTAARQLAIAGRRSGG